MKKLIPLTALAFLIASTVSPMATSSLVGSYRTDHWGPDFPTVLTIQKVGRDGKVVGRLRGNFGSRSTGLMPFDNAIDGTLTGGILHLTVYPSHSTYDLTVNRGELAGTYSGKGQFVQLQFERQ